MGTSDIKIHKLKSAFQRRWRISPSSKAQRYINQFTDRKRIEQKIEAKVEGNHGTYNVSIELGESSITSVCSCHIGSDGDCHHCEALAYTFLQNFESFKEIKHKERTQLKNIQDLPSYLNSMSLEYLVKKLKKFGIAQKSLADSIGMNPNHLSSIKSCEKRNRYYNELGATKLACIWILENLKNQSRQ